MYRYLRKIVEGGGWRFGQGDCGGEFFYFPSHMRGRAVLNQWYGYIRVEC